MSRPGKGLELKGHQNSDLTTSLKHGMHSLLSALKHLNLLIFYKIVFAIFILPSGLLADCPYELTFFNFPNSSVEDVSTLRNHTFVYQTKQCYDDFSENVAQTEPIDSCSPGDLEVLLYPHSVLPVGTNISPHATLNITITAFVPVEKLFIQFHCLHAPDAEDVYCHDHERQIARWGKMVWPCRELQLAKYSGTSTSTALNFTTPLRLTYNCFRLFSLSHYEVNITTWPKPCRMSFIATIPVIQHLEPRVREFIDFKGDEKLPLSAQPNWSPLLYVDVSSTDGVWIRFEPIAWISQTFHNYISIVIFERSPVDEKTHMLLAKKIGLSQNGFRWENVAAGEYLVYAFVEKINCQLSCESSSFTENSGLSGGCKICPHTSINFTLVEDRFTPEWRQNTRVMGIAKAIGIGIFGKFF
uniref:Uncharacterized protein n=1 Tax=Ditylenchus dipsaci TaxID=166011 RepID=A0A915DY58_9BILA